MPGTRRLVFLHQHSLAIVTGEVLEDPCSFKTKEEFQAQRAWKYILQPEVVSAAVTAKCTNKVAHQLLSAAW